MEMERKGIIEVLATIFPNQAIVLEDDDSFIDKLGMDSISFVSYVIGIESKFDIEVPVSNAIYEAVYTDITPEQLLSKLMNRKLKEEERYV